MIRFSLLMCVLLVASGAVAQDVKPATPTVAPVVVAPHATGAEAAAPAEQKEEALPWLDLKPKNIPSYTVSIAYEINATDLPLEGNDMLVKVVEKLKANPDARVTLLSYAGNDNTKLNEGRRISLKRAMDIRKALMLQGIETRRVIIRALGKDHEHPKNTERVDLQVE